MHIPLFTRNEASNVSFETLRWLIILAACGISVGLGIVLSAVELSIGDVIIGVLGFLVLLTLISADKNILRGVMYAGLLTFGFGFRELHIEGFRVHPDQVVFWVLATSLVIGSIVLKRQVQFTMHWSMFVFFGLVTIAVPVGLFNGVQAGDVLTRYFIWLTLIPVFFVTQNLIENLGHVRIAIWFLIAVAFYIALLGVAEYALPELFAPFRSELATDTATQITSGGYIRSAFSVFGNPFVANYLAWMLPVILWMALDNPKENWLLKSLGLVTLVFCVLAIYVSGNRAALLVSVLVFGMYAVLTRHWWWLLFLAVPIFLDLLPETFYRHLIVGTLIDPEHGNIIRENLWRRGIELTMNNPFGNGLGMGYLSHNDYIQIAADIGIPALALFLVACLRLLRNLWHVIQGNNLEDKRLAGVFSIAIIGTGTSILFHPLFETAAVAVPIWFIAAIAFSITRLVDDAMKQNGT